MCTVLHKGMGSIFFQVVLGYEEVKAEYTHAIACQIPPVELGCGMQKGP